MNYRLRPETIGLALLLLVSACGGGGVSVDTAFDRQARRAVEQADEVPVSFAMQQNTATTGLTRPASTIELAGITVTAVVVYYKAFGFETTSPLHCDAFASSAETEATASAAPECDSSNEITALTVPSFRRRNLLNPQQESVFLPAVTSEVGYLELGSPGTTVTDWVLTALGTRFTNGSPHPVTITSRSELSLQFNSQDLDLVSTEGITFLLGADQLFAPVLEQIEGCLSKNDAAGYQNCAVDYAPAITEAFAGDITHTE